MSRYFISWKIKITITRLGAASFCCNNFCWFWDDNRPPCRSQGGQVKAKDSRSSKLLGPNTTTMIFFSGCPILPALPVLSILIIAIRSFMAFFWINEKGHFKRKLILPVKLLKHFTWRLSSIILVFLGYLEISSLFPCQAITVGEDGFVRHWTSKRKFREL